MSNEILATVGLDKKIKVWNYITKELLTSYSCSDYIQSLTYDSINYQLIFIDTNGQLGFWNDDLFSKQNSSLPPERSAEKVEENNNNNNKMEIIDQKPEDKTLAPRTEDKEKKKTYIKSDADTWIDAPPQNIIHSSSSTLFKMRRFISWNLVGTIILRKDNEFSFLDIDFSDKTFHKNVRTRDVYNISMGTMNYMGAILASKAESVNENEYENELEKDETKKCSYIQYKSFTYNYEAYDWIHKLQKNENVECVCIGSIWCAAATDFNFLRIFNLVGIELNVINYEKPIVCMAGYENLLAYIMHDSVPIFGTQNLKLIIIDVNTMKVIKECPLPVTPYSTLSWFGFSQEGLLILQENTGIVKAFFNESSFITLHDINAEEGKEKKKFWLVGMTDYELIGVGLNKDELEPGCFPLPQTKIININLPFIKNSDNYYEKIMWKKLKLEHEKYRKKMWSSLKFSREKNDILSIYSSNIMSEPDVAKAELEIDKMFAEYFREFLVKGEFEKAISVVSSMIKNLKTVEICIVLCNKMNLSKVADKVNNVLTARRKRSEFELINNKFERQMILNPTKEIVSVPTNENVQAPKPKNKTYLSDLAVYKQTPLTLESIQQKNKKPSNKLPDLKPEEFEVKEDEDETKENVFILSSLFIR